jgi:hypothetical protein
VEFTKARTTEDEMDDRCHHEGCGCKVERADAYCSEHCREASEKGVGDKRCGCGHSGCK